MKNKNMNYPVLIQSTVSDGVFYFPQTIIYERKTIMNKTRIAIFFGGCSSEYEISLASACSVLSSLDTEKYTPYPVGITRTGKWYYFSGDIEKIRQDRWMNDSDCISAALSPDRDLHSLMLIRQDHIDWLEIDAAFPVMHGRYGEDGTIQGLINTSGVPIIGCGVLASAIGMDKNRAHQLASLAGIDVPRSVVLTRRDCENTVLPFAADTGWPLFVKPLKAGSSCGITRVQNEAELFPALRLAFAYDDEVIIEENIDGFEVGCAVMGNDELTVGEVDEIELSGGFFDFTEKYTLKTSAIHVPARIGRETADRIKESAKTIYRALGCSGFARVDLFLTPDERIVFNEVNTIPGFTEHSRYPGMMKAAGISFPELLDKIIELAVMKK